MKIAIVLPIYNEEKRIAEVFKNLKKINLPLIIINDGSTDRTLEHLKKVANMNKEYYLVSHSINLGKGSAMSTGGEVAFREGFDAVIFMDADGQHDPGDLHKFIKELDSGKYDIVLGSRNLHHGVPLIRFLGNKFASVLISVLFGIYVSDILSGFRAVTKKAFKKLHLESTGYGVETEMIVKMARYKLKCTEVTIRTIYHDKHKGVTITDAFGILFDVLRWRILL